MGAREPVRGQNNNFLNRSFIIVAWLILWGWKGIFGNWIQNELLVVGILEKKILSLTQLHALVNNCPKHGPRVFKLQLHLSSKLRGRELRNLEYGVFLAIIMKKLIKYCILLCCFAGCFVRCKRVSSERRQPWLPDKSIWRACSCCSSFLSPKLHQAAAQVFYANLQSLSNDKEAIKMIYKLLLESHSFKARTIAKPLAPVFLFWTTASTVVLATRVYSPRVHFR